MALISLLSIYVRIGDGGRPCFAPDQAIAPAEY